MQSKEELDSGNKRKMKAGVIVRPRTKHGQIIGVLFLLIIIAASVPVINLVNKPKLILFGMPVLFVWTIGIVASVIGVLRLAIHWGVK